ncbi:MAG: Sensor histidine kinase RcsC [Phycisphaerales bacterium]|nr:Sensor histidine kinase RcsC [Phycisphaerales bacterium]
MQVEDRAEHADITTIEDGRPVAAARVATQPGPDDSNTHRIARSLAGWWPPGRLPNPVSLFAFITANIAAAGIGQGLKLIPGVAITFWPPSGIFVAALILSRRSSWIWWTLAACLAELIGNFLWFGNPPHLALVYFGANAAEAWFAAMLVQALVARRWLSKPERCLRETAPPATRESTDPDAVRSVSAVLPFVLLAAVVAPIVGATIISATDALVGKHAFWTAWKLVWLGDGTGLVVSAPLTLAAVEAWRDRRRIQWRRAAEFIGLVAASAGLACAAMNRWLPTVYLALPPLVFAAARFQIMGASVSLAMILLTVAQVTRAGRGEFSTLSALDAQERIVALQVFLGISAVTSLTVAALSARHTAALDRLRQLNRTLEDRIGDRTAALRESEEQFRSLADAIPQLAWIANADGWIYWYNRRWYEYTGTTPRQMEGWGWRSVHDAKVLPAVMERWTESIATGKAFDMVFPLRGADGRFRSFLTRIQPVVNAEGRVVRWFGTNTDIEELKRAEDALRQSEERYRSLFESIDEGFCVFDMLYDDSGRPVDYRFVEVNPAFEKITGISDAEGRTIRQLIPEVADRWLEIYDRVASTGEPVRFENRDETQLRWFDIYAFRLGKAQDRRVATIFTDITQRKNDEEELRRHRAHLQHLVNERTAALEASQERLRLSERMASLGTLAAGLGHDMGNLLLPVRVKIETLETMDLPDEARRELEGIRSSIGYLRKLASGLRLLALDPVNVTRELTDVSSWWAEAEPILRNALPRGVTLRARIPDLEIIAVVGRASLTQIVFNLVQNAGDAMKSQPGGGVVSVTGRVEDDQFVLTLSDNGPGMTDEVKRRCMEPFFTTKPRGVSTGLGLALSYSLVKQADGSIELHSDPGKGTTFTLRFARSLSTRPAPSRPRNAAVVLADARMRAYVTAELARLNFEVRPSVEEAELVVTDNPVDGLRARVVVVNRTHKASDVRAALAGAAGAPPPGA